MISTQITRYWGWIALLAWGGLAIGLDLLRFDAYGIDESAARALLINWTIADGVVNPIITLGTPDFRALFFLPLGAYWSGSFIALKVFMLLITFGAVALLYRWCKESQGSEAALLASGLLLIAPLSFMQINAVGAGPFLLLGFGLGVWLNQLYRDKGKPLSGWFFMQLLLVITLVSIHPAGLAYPLALAWEWRKNPTNDSHQKQMLIGIAITAIFALLFSYLLGNPAIEWGLNPMISLAATLMGHIPGDPSITDSTAGILPAILLFIVAVIGRKTLLTEFMPRMLFLGTLLGLASADYGWAMLALALTLYIGIPQLIKLNDGFGVNSFVGQRGIILAIVFITATTFMLGDRSYRSSVINATLSSHDELIQILATETAEREDKFFTVSQWPARTMLALKRPVFPLPPVYETPEELLKNISKIKFVVFDPSDPANRALRLQLANLIGKTETLIQQPDGVIVKIKEETE